MVPINEAGRACIIREVDSGDGTDRCEPSVTRVHEQAIALAPAERIPLVNQISDTPVALEERPISLNLVCRSGFQR